MALASMTGFARSEASHGNTRWAWEIRSVNGKSLDVRMRLPSGLEELEPALRENCTRLLSRGNVSVGLSVQRDQGEAVLVVNEPALEAVLNAIQVLHRRLPEAAPPTLDGILAHRGVLELKEPVEDEAARKQMIAVMTASFARAVEGLRDMRNTEGKAIGEVLFRQLSTIGELVESAENLPSRKVETIRERLASQVRELLEAAPALDPQRLHQEAVLLATKADIREELDRLKAHVAAARTLLETGGAIGRKLDFLAQEFNREANTLCSKSNDVGLTAIGLELKSVIDQMREQVQNLE